MGRWVIEARISARLIGRYSYSKGLTGSPVVEARIAVRSIS